MYAAIVWSLAIPCLPAGAADRSSIARVPKPVAAGAPWSATELATLRDSLDAMLAGAPAVLGAHVGAIALETRSGVALYERNATDYFVPASTAKLVTGSVALARLGPGFHFTTSLLATGPIAGGELQGDLVLRGGGDPLLSVADIENAAAAVASAGIRSVAGTVKIDSAYFAPKRYGDGWSVDDIPFDYMPPLSGLSLEENVVHVTVLPGANAGDPAELRPEPASAVHASAAGGCLNGEFAFALVDRVTTGAGGSKGTLDVAREPCGAIVIAGSIARGSPPAQIDAAVPSPETYASDVFRAALGARGVRVAAGAAADPATIVSRYRASEAGQRVLWTHDSKPLSELLADFWYPSDNLIGEALLRALGIERSGPPGTDANGLALVEETLAAFGVPPRGIELADGSGLSRYDLATPNALALLLQAGWNGPYRDLILDSLPVAGVRGTLAQAFIGTPAERRVFAKSGSMTRVSALAGYLANERHGAVTFAILVDDWLGGSAALDDLRARMLSRLAGG